MGRWPQEALWCLVSACWSTLRHLILITSREGMSHRELVYCPRTALPPSSVHWKEGQSSHWPGASASPVSPGKLVGTAAPDCCYTDLSPPSVPIPRATPSPPLPWGKAGIFYNTNNHYHFLSACCVPSIPRSPFLGDN